MYDNLFINIAKKQIEKAIVKELYKKDILDFSKYNSIIKKIDENIVKLENKIKAKRDMTNMIVKITI